MNEYTVLSTGILVSLYRRVAPATDGADSERLRAV